MSPTEKLNSLIESFGILKDTVTKLKSDQDAYNNEIKIIMRENGLDNAESDSFTAKYQVVKSENFDEDLLLVVFSTVPALIEANDQYGIIKTKSYIDMNAMENAIYEGAVDPKMLANYKITKETERLTVALKTKKPARRTKTKEASV